MSENNFPHIFGWKTVEKNSSPISLSQNPISLSARPYLLPLCSTLISLSARPYLLPLCSTLSPSLLDEAQAPSTTLSPSLLDEALHNPISLSQHRTASLFSGNVTGGDGTLWQRYSHLVCPSLSL